MKRPFFLLVLVVMLLAACGARQAAAPVAEVATPVPATAIPATATPVPPTAIPATATPVPPTATPEPAVVESEVASAAAAYFSAGLKTISADALYENLNDGDDSNNPTIISVRKAEDDAVGHIPGAINVTPAELFDAEVLATIPQDKPVVVYCYTGQTAAQVVPALNMLGYDASSLLWGMSGWTTDPTVYVNRFDPAKAKDYTTVTDEFVAEETYAMSAPLADDLAEAANAYFDKGLKTIQADALYENLNDGDTSNDPFIISVRSAEDYAKGHLPGAVQYDPKTIFTPEVLSTIPSDRPVVVYCYTGQTASQVVSGLNLLGYDANNLVYGMGMWTNDPAVYVKRFDPEKTPKDYTVETGPAAKAGAAAAGDDLAMAVEGYFSNGIKTISADALYENLNDGDDDNNPTIISVRKPEDYAAGHIPGAINLTPAELFDADVLATIPQDKPVVVYCYSGQTAGQVVPVLNAMGYDASSLLWGMGGWTTDPAVYVNRFDPAKVKGYATTTDEFVSDETYTEPEALGDNFDEAANAYFDAGIKTVQADALYENLNDGDDSNDPFIISVRSVEDYGKGHLPGAVNYDVKTLFTPEVLATIPTDRPLVVYCYTGQTASQVVSGLNLLGYDASNLVYGMSMWSDDPNVYVKRFDPEKTPKNYPVESGN